MNLWKKLFGGASTRTPTVQRESPAQSSSSFVSACFAHPYKAVPDKRTASDFMEVDEIDKLINDDNYATALALVQECLIRHPDFYVFHGRRAHLYSAMGDGEKEKEAYLEALEKSLRKYYACDSLAQLAFEQGNDHDAVLWWVRACDLQLQIDEMRYPRCFICLAYVAVGLGDIDSEQWLRQCADRTPSLIDLNAESANRHYQVGVRASNAENGDAFRAAIRELRDRATASGR